MKKIQLTPEWVLENLPDSAFSYDDNEFVITTLSHNSANLICQALDELGIVYGNDTIEYGPEDDPIVDLYEYFWIMYKEDIRKQSPNLYLEWIKKEKDKSLQ